MGNCNQVVKKKEKDVITEDFVKMISAFMMKGDKLSRNANDFLIKKLRNIMLNISS